MQLSVKTGIIFQAKDTRNRITNETAYDNEQLAQLQNELKDNQLYSGIGIIPGTDIGGGSEGGENGTVNSPINSGGQTNQGENINSGVNQGETNTNQLTNNLTAGDIVEGKTAQDPIIKVTDGIRVAVNQFCSNITVQIFTQDKTQRIKYILTTTVADINNELYPSGLIKELDIENGGTLTFTRDGEYTITAYAYDGLGNKSNPTVMWIKKDERATPANGVKIVVLSGQQGEPGYYRSDVTVQIDGVNYLYDRIKYKVTGVAKSDGTIAGRTVKTEEVIDTGEIQTTRTGIFEIAADGIWTITPYVWDNFDWKYAGRETIITRDTKIPKITTFKSTNVAGTSVDVEVSCDMGISGSATEGAYTYFVGTEKQKTTNETIYQYTGLERLTTYTDLKVIAKDKAGNESLEEILPEITTTVGVYEFPYTGREELLNIPCSGSYLIEVWGAQGGNGGSRSGGMGGYSKGMISLEKDEVLYVYVGGRR